MGRAVGFGINGKPEFFIREGDLVRPAVHLAFRSPDRATVDRYHEAALSAGGKVVSSGSSASEATHA